LAKQKTLEVSISLIDLLHLQQHCRFYIRQPNGDGLHWTASKRSNFSAIASLQKAEIFRQRLLFNSSSVWWSCWVLHQQAGEELVDNLLGGAGEEALGEVLGRGGYGSGLRAGCLK